MHARPKARVRLYAALVFGAMLATGCKTQDDAAAAATQMAATAKALTDYYSALKVIVVNLDKLRALNHDLYERPYSEESQKILQGEATKLDQRAKLADGLTSLATEFGKLTGSTAPADVATAADKLASAAESLASVKESDVEQTALKVVTKQLVQLVQEHKERQIAKAMAPLAKAMASFFSKDKVAWEAREQEYASLSAKLADNLVNDGHTANADVLKVALDPYGLVPLSSPELNSKLSSVAKAQIEDGKKTLENGYTSATDAMDKSLTEMATRIETVSEDKAMAFRLPPLTVNVVEKWAADTLGSGSASATAETDGGKSTGSKTKK